MFFDFFTCTGKKRDTNLKKLSRRLSICPKATFLAETKLRFVKFHLQEFSENCPIRDLKSVRKAV